MARKMTVVLGSLLLPLFPAPGHAQLGGAGTAKASLELFADRSSYEPGETVGLAARITVEPGWHVQSHEPSLEFLIPTELDLDLPAGSTEPEIDYPEAHLWQPSFETEKLAVYEETFIIYASFGLPEAEAVEPLSVAARLSYQACDDRVCLAPTEASAQLILGVGPGGVATYAELFDATQPPDSPPPPLSQLALMILVGILGGLILNAMPCVLPVLSLKVFSLVKAAGEGPRELRIGALATAAGILASFIGLAAIAIGAKAAGQFVGWGVQFQNPVFVTFLILVVVVFALNLWGLFEVPLPQALTRIGAARSQHGLLGHFWWGLFATLMATPCSAPYLGTAVGFALSQRSTVILTVFAAIGFGMALPYLALAAAPGGARLLPRPGAWMEHLRGVMGFLLAGTAVWLLYVLAAQIGSVKLVFVELALLIVALFAWSHRRLDRHPGLRRAAAAGLVATCAAALLLAAGPTVDAGRQEAPDGLIAWGSWDQEEAESLAASGRLVFVDVTADWCATCKFNEQLVLETEDVAAVFDEHDVIAMKADWTNRDDEIAAYLARFGRYGIPFYLLYRPHDEPFVFGELLTKDKVIRVITEAAASRSTELADHQPSPE